MKLRGWMLGMLLGSCAPLWAQDELDQIIEGSVQDANYLMQGYAAPLLKALGYGLNQAWYNSARPHKLGGFDITVTASPVYYSAGDEFYTVDNTQLTNLQLTDPSDGIVPTILGPDDVDPVYLNTQTGFTVNGPSGIDPKKLIGIKAVPIPMVQAGIGLPKGTEVKVRFFPQSEAGERTQYRFWGAGIQHDIKQYIRPLKPLPIDISILAAYSTYQVRYNVDSANPDQIADFTGDTFTVQALGSAKFSVLTVYGGVGYGGSKNSLAMLGSYDFSNPPPLPPTTVQDPVDVATDVSGFLATLGMRLRFGFIALHGQYTLQEYDVLTVGFGINFH
jgi:hypothetical protein